MKIELEVNKCSECPYFQSVRGSWRSTCKRMNGAQIDGETINEYCPFMKKPIEPQKSPTLDELKAEYTKVNEGKKINVEFIKGVNVTISLGYNADDDFLFEVTNVYGSADNIEIDAYEIIIDYLKNNEEGQTKLHQYMSKNMSKKCLFDIQDFEDEVAKFNKKVIEYHKLNKIDKPLDIWYELTFGDLDIKKLDK